MGTWDTGPFDNDRAADWCGELHDADPDLRPQLLRAALSRTADVHGYLDSNEACEAIAAAAILASQKPGGAPITSAYAPEFLRDGDAPELPGDLPALAIRALDRIMADESEWRDLWQDEASPDGETAAFENISSLRRVLTTP